MVLYSTSKARPDQGHLHLRLLPLSMTQTVYGVRDDTAYDWSPAVIFRTLERRRLTALSRF